MDSDTKGQLHEDFDYVINELRENGEIKDVSFVSEQKDNLGNIVGNVIGEMEVLDRETKDGKPFTVVNFALLSKDKDGNSVITNWEIRRRFRWSSQEIVRVKAINIE